MSSNGSQSPTEDNGPNGSNGSNEVNSGLTGNTGNTGNNGNTGDNSSNVTVNTSNISNNDDFKNLTLDETITQEGLIITNKQGTTVNGNEKTESTFASTDLANNTVNITQDLIGTVIAQYDNSTVTGQLVSQIADYASKIKCSEFHGKGSIDDYNELFIAAAAIANETKQMTLDVDVEGFGDFAKAADDLSALFTSFTKKLQNVNIIDDSVFLRAVLNALVKIDNLSNVFGRFKETILITSTVRIPQSSNIVANLLNGVMGEVNCAMGYINNFVTVNPNLPQGQLSNIDKNIISQATNTIENWAVLCNQGVSIALANSPDIQCIKNVNSSLSQQVAAMNAATAALKSKFLLLNPIP